MSFDSASQQVMSLWAAALDDVEKLSTTDFGMDTPDSGDEIMVVVTLPPKYESDGTTDNLRAKIETFKKEVIV